MLVAAVVVENVWDATLSPFNVYNPLPPQTAFPVPSLVNTAPLVL